MYMNEHKASIILEHLSKLCDNFKLTDEFWKRLLEAEIFPYSYIEEMKNNEEIDPIHKKKNLLIDISRREATAYEKLSKIFRDLFDCNLLDDLKQDYYINQRPGYCLIINNENFGGLIEKRYGSDKDVSKFEKAFEKLGFNIDVHCDLKQKQIRNLLKKLCNDEILKYRDMFVLVIMSHGYSSHIVTTDGEYISYDEIINQFSNQRCPNLIDKPKILIFNCCRVALPEETRKNIEKSSYRTSSIFEDDIPPRRHEIKDMVIIYSTLDNLFSVRHEDLGTFFADAFVESLVEYRESDICKIVREANKLLIKKVKEGCNTVERSQVIEMRMLGVKKMIYFKDEEECRPNNVSSSPK